jgi:hypothetical protein
MMRRLILQIVVQYMSISGSYYLNWRSTFASTYINAIAISTKNAIALIVTNPKAIASFSKTDTIAFKPSTSREASIAP